MGRDLGGWKRRLADWALHFPSLLALAGRLGEPELKLATANKKTIPRKSKFTQIVVSNLFRSFSGRGAGDKRVLKI